MNRWLKLLILSYLSLLFFGSFFAIGALWIGVFDNAFPMLSDIKMSIYYFLAGAIGGSLRHLYMFCSHYMENELNNYRDWIRYIFYPLFATGTAIIAVTIIQSGILMIDFTDNVDDPYAQVCIAFFVGFGFNRFLNKLNEISTNIFETKNQQKTIQKSDIDTKEG